MPITNCGLGNKSPVSASSQNPSVFFVGLAALVLLWLPPLPWTLKAANLPAPILQALAIFKAVKPTETWLLRWDYFFFPPLMAYALWTIWKSKISFGQAGLGLTCFMDACRYLWKPMLVGVLILLGIGALNHSIDITPRFWKRLNPLAAFFQQMVIQLYFNRQLSAWFGAGRKTAWILTLFFVMLHAPNPGLMLGTLFGAYFWVRCYQQHPNLYALAVSHAFLSAFLMHTMPKWLLPSVSVGHRFIEKGIAHHWWGWMG